MTENFVNESNLVDCYREISVNPDAVRAKLTSLSLEKARRVAARIAGKRPDLISELEAEWLSAFLGFRLRGLREEIGHVQGGLDGLRAAVPELAGAASE